jgi:hypothetical protein
VGRLTTTIKWEPNTNGSKLLTEANKIVDAAFERSLAVA